MTSIWHRLVVGGKYNFMCQSSGAGWCRARKSFADDALLRRLWNATRRGCTTLVLKERKRGVDVFGTKDLRKISHSVFAAEFELCLLVEC
jgi:hypothetical protein